MAQEIDLHTKAFMRNISGLTNEDVIQHSLDRLHMALQDAIRQKQFEISFIHGIGSGVLKDRVYQELQEYKNKRLIVSFEPSFFNEGVVSVRIAY